MKTSKAPATTFSRAEWALAVALIAALALATSLAGRAFIRAAEHDRVEAASTTALRAVGERVIEMRGVIKSMLGMHYASDEFGGVDIESFAEQLRAYSPFVRSIGIFGTVDAPLRDGYEAYHAERTGLDFSITRWTENGATGQIENIERYMPIESIDPLDAVGERFLGTDLGSVEAIADALELSVASGRSFVAAMPVDWPIDGDALLIQPVYLSAEPPREQDERQATHLGGIWIAIDLSQALQAAVEDLGAASTRLQTYSRGSQSATLFYSAGNSDDHGIDVGFSPANAVRSWMLGDSRLTMSIRAPLTAQAQGIWLVFFCAMVAAALGATATATLYQQRVVRDERARGSAAIDAEREKARRTLESISDAVITVDAAGRLLYANPSTIEWFGIDAVDHPDTLLRDQIRFERVENGSCLDLSQLSAFLESEDGRKVIDVRVYSPCPTESTYELTITPMTAQSALADGYILVLQNVSREREMTAELERRAHHDSLTGCYNRFFFENRLRELVEGAQTHPLCHALCYIDLDKFKIVNDTCGHPAGDRLLCELTEALQARLRPGDVFARLGGDEFGVIFVDVQPGEAQQVAGRLYEHFQNAAFEHDGHVFPVRGSMGLVEISEHDRDLKRILKCADIACYDAKSGGRNALVVFDGKDDSRARQLEEVNWFPMLEQAIEDDRFELLAQPILYLGDEHRASYYEFLLRLINEQGDRVTPHHFMRAAERYDLMRVIDQRVIERAVQTAAAFDAPDAVFSVNLGAQTVADPAALAFISDTVSEYSLDPSRLCFEIGESTAIKHFSEVLVLCEGLRELGARIVLDDFGAGLSSFACLRDLSIDMLKIDGHFVGEIVANPLAREIVLAMHQMARAKGIETVAKKVEDAATLAAVKSIGIDHAQGWHIAKPMSPASLTQVWQATGTGRAA